MSWHLQNCSDITELFSDTIPSFLLQWYEVESSIISIYLVCHYINFYLKIFEEIFEFLLCLRLYDNRGYTLHSSAAYIKFQDLCAATGEALRLVTTPFGLVVRSVDYEQWWTYSVLIEIPSLLTNHPNKLCQTPNRHRSTALFFRVNTHFNTIILSKSAGREP